MASPMNFQWIWELFFLLLLWFILSRGRSLMKEQRPSSGHQSKLWAGFKAGFKGCLGRAPKCGLTKPSPGCVGLDKRSLDHEQKNLQLIKQGLIYTVMVPVLWNLQFSLFCDQKNANFNGEMGSLFHWDWSFLGRKLELSQGEMPLVHFGH